MAELRPLAAGALAVIAVCWVIGRVHVSTVRFFTTPFEAGEFAKALERATKVEEHPLLRWARDVRFVARVIQARVHLVAGPMTTACDELRALTDAAPTRVHWFPIAYLVPYANERSRRVGECRLLLGISLLHGGHYAEAGQVLTEAMGGAEDDPRIWAPSVRMLAATEIRRGWFSEAHQHIELAASRARPGPERSLVSRISGSLAAAEREWDEARKQFHRALRGWSNRSLGRGERMDHAITMHLLAVACAHEGDLEEAHTWQQRAHQLVDGHLTNEDRHFPAAAWNCEATVARLAGDATGALALATQAVAGFEGLDEDTRCYARREQARALRDLGDVAHARTRYAEVLAWFEEHGAAVEARATRDELDAL